MWTILFLFGEKLLPVISNSIIHFHKYFFDLRFDFIKMYFNKNTKNLKKIFQLIAIEVSFLNCQEMY